MVSEARGINPLGRNPNINHLPGADLAGKRRLDLAYRLLDNRLISGYVLKSPIVKFGAQVRNLKNTIIDALSFDYAPINPILEASIGKVDRLLDSEILAKANQLIADFHKEQRSSLPIPDVEGFFKLATFGEFDPQQYILVNTLGTAHTVMEAVKARNLEKLSESMSVSLGERFEAGYILLRAAEIASRQ